MAEGWKGLHEKNGETVFSCPEPWCYFHVLAPGGTNVEHNCPHSGKTTLGWSAVLSTIERIWKEIDDRFTMLMESEDRKDPIHEKAKGELRGLAVALAIITAPRAEGPDAIAREASARYKARLAGEEVVTYSGQGIVLANKPADQDKWVPSVSGGYTAQPEYSIHAKDSKVQFVAGETGPSNKHFETELAKRDLRPQDIAAVKNVISMGLMPIHEVAKMYSISVGLATYLGKL